MSTIDPWNLKKLKTITTKNDAYSGIFFSGVHKKHHYRFSIAAFWRVYSDILKHWVYSSVWKDL